MTTTRTGRRDPPYLMEHLAKCRPKDVPRWAEKVLVAVDGGNKGTFIKVVEGRMGDMRPPQAKRLKKVIEVAAGR